MKKIISLLLLLTVAFAAASCGITANETQSSSAVSESTSEQSQTGSLSGDESDEPQSSEVQQSSEEQQSSEMPQYDTDTAQPKIYGCTRIEDGRFVILGTCEQDAVITASTPSKTVVTKSDHGYFSARIDSKSTNVAVTLTAQTEGKNPSEPLEYTAKPVSVSNSQWNLIAGLNYQFHLQYTLSDFLRNNTYNSSQLSALTSKLSKRVERLKTQSPDTEIIYLIIPSPATIYPETMPDSYTPLNNPSRLEQVTQAITDAGIKVIDIKTAFEEHKNDEYKLYWKTDSHWTDYGAFIAYTELFDYISQKHPECKPRSFDEFEWKEDTYIGGDMAMYLEYFNTYKYDETNTPMREYNVLRVPEFDMPSQITSIRRYVSESRLTYDPTTVQLSHTISTNRSELPTALVMRDSYSTQIFDILAERFDKTYYKAMWEYSWDNNEIQSKKPDYVIYVLVERNLDSLFN